MTAKTQEIDTTKEGFMPVKMLTCFLCEKTGIIVKKFDEERLEKCRKTLAFRKKKYLVYKDVILPKSCLQQKGYHLQCYDKFIVLKNNNKKEFASMFGNSKVLINNIPPLKVESPKAIKFKKIAPSTSKIVEIPKLIEIPKIGKKDCDIELKTTPFQYQMDEPSYVNPDIARGVILKSILTRKSPIKRDIMQECSDYNSGMDLFRYGQIFNQPNLNFGPEKFEPKIVETFTLNKNVCVFCGDEQRKIGIQLELSEMLKENECEKVLEIAEAMQDEKLIEKLKKNKVFMCHPLCRVECKNKYQKITSKNCDEDDKLVIKNLQSIAFECLCSFIDKEIIEKNKTYFLTDLFERFKLILLEIQNTDTPLDVENYTITQLQEEILNRYENIKITTKNKKKVVYKDGQTNFEIEDFNFDKLAFELRSEIKSLKRKSDDKIVSEIPEKLAKFIGCIIRGPATTNSFEDRFKIKSICENIVANVNLD